jgi:small subunit ribosomal protein S6
VAWGKRPEVEYLKDGFPNPSHKKEMQRTHQEIRPTTNIERSFALAGNVYEGMFILDSNRFGRDPETVSGRISTMVETLGGEMLVSRLWEERRLAYAIKGQRKGAYWLTYFRLDGGRVADLRRQCRISEDVVRALFLKVDPRIVDALVAHAKSAPVVAPSSDDEVKVQGDVIEDAAVVVVDAVEGAVVEIEEDV